MKTILAIDFGTTTTVFAATTDCDEFAPKILEIDGNPVTDSVLRLTSDGKSVEMVGRDAWDKAVEAPDRTAYDFKLHIGDPQKLPVANGVYTAKDISVLYLTTLRKKLEHDVWNGGTINNDVHMTVIGYPAEWTEVQRQETLDIVKLAGFPNVIGCSEPVAAVYYQHYTRNLDIQQVKTVLIYDFGGGTADVCLVRSSEGEQPDILAQSGSQHLGGRYIDEILCQHFTDTLLKEADLQSVPAKDWTMLRRETRRIKEKLSQAIFNGQPLTDATIPRLDSIGSSYRISLTQDAFEASCSSIISGTETPVWDILSKAGIEATDVDAVLLAGGASQLYFVKEKMQLLFPGKTIIEDKNPQHIIVKGLALFGRTKLADGELFKKSASNAAGTSLSKQEKKEFYKTDSKPSKQSFVKKLITGAVFVVACIGIWGVFSGGNQNSAPTATSQVAESVACNIYLDFEKENVLDVECGFVIDNAGIVLDFADYEFEKISCDRNTHNKRYAYRVTVANNYIIRSFSRTPLQVIEKNAWPSDDKVFSDHISLSNSEVRTIKNRDEVDKPFKTFRVVFSPSR